MNTSNRARTVLPWAALVLAAVGCARPPNAQSQPTHTRVMAPNVQSNVDATAQSQTFLAHQVVPAPDPTGDPLGYGAQSATAPAPTTAPTPATPTAPATPTPAPSTAAASSDATPPTPGVRMFRGHEEDELLREMASRPVQRVIERFNSSTLVYHCDLGNGLEIAFKPARRGERNWWIHEVAGYELARTLGIEGRVPPATYKRVPVSMFADFSRDARLVVRDGMVEGAAIFWMPVLRRTNLHTAESRAVWNPWMNPRNPIPAEHRTRALQIAELIAFDYLQANFDRWNSANVPQDERGDMVYRDNNRAWFMVNLRRVSRGGLRGIRRVPASFLPRLERATDSALRARTHRTHPYILSNKQLEAYEVRRLALIRQISRAIRRFGRENVLIE